MSKKESKLTEFEIINLKSIKKMFEVKENFKFIVLKNNLNVFIIFFSLFLITSSCKKEKNRICEIYDGNVGYAIGTIQSYATSPFKVVYKYDYSVDGIGFEGKEKAYGIGQKDEGLIGKSFVVIYELGNPSNSDLNINYSIETDDDFKEFKNEFSSSPPPPDFPTNCE